jgi:SNF2 family DNA or RNA helicase
MPRMARIHGAWQPVPDDYVEEIAVPLGPTYNVQLADGRLVMDVPFVYIEQCKLVPGRRWDPNRRVWTAAATPATANTVLGIFRQSPLSIDPAVVALGALLATATGYRDRDDLPEHPSRRPSWMHQRKAYEFAKRLPAAALFMDMGTGKSKVVVDLIVNRGIQRTLIVCPKSMLRGWPEKFLEDAPAEWLAGTDIVVLDERRTVRQRAELMRLAPSPVVFVVNFEAFQWTDPRTSSNPMADVAAGTGVELLVLDESHKIKAPNGVTSKRLATVGQRIPNKLALTGTPQPHSPLDIYAQYRVLDPGVFGTNFARFRDTYAVMGGYQGREILGWQNQELLASKIYSIAFRVEADEVLDLPPFLDETVTVRMSDRARRAYREIETAAVARIEQGTATAANCLVEFLRLQQITSGFLPVSDPDDLTAPTVEVVLDSAKRDALRDLLEGMHEPAVVYCRFTRDLAAVRAVAEELGRSYGELSGQHDDLDDTSRMPADLDVLGVQVRAGSAGVDFTRARYGIYYSLGFSLGDYEQSRARIRRPGQNHPVTYYHLLVEDSIDEYVMASIRDKAEIVDYIINRLRYDRLGEDPAGLMERNRAWDEDGVDRDGWPAIER